MRIPNAYRNQPDRDAVKDTDGLHGSTDGFVATFAIVKARQDKSPQKEQANK